MCALYKMRKCFRFKKSVRFVIVNGGPEGVMKLVEKGHEKWIFTVVPNSLIYSFPFFLIIDNNKRENNDGMGKSVIDKILENPVYAH